MTWLNAVLAFALSMIVFSTIVSALTELLHRLFHMRERGLARMLGRLYDDYLAPEVVPKLKVVKDGLREKLVDELTRNRAVEPHGSFPLIGSWFAPRRLGVLSAEEFVRRLAELPMGREIQTLGKEQGLVVATTLMNHFERIGADATAYFQERARMISVTLALVVAFLLNVDAVRLYSTFASDQELTARLLGQAEAIEDAYRRQAAATGAAMTQPEATPQRLAEARDDLKQALDASSALGLPIGWEYFPWCRLVDASAVPIDPKCAPEVAPVQDSGIAGLLWLWGGWFLSTFLAGVLIGLGGPFWFDAFRRLSFAISFIRPSVAVRDAADRAGVSAPADAAVRVSSATTAPQPQVRSLADVFFETATGVRRRARLLLGSDGRPL